jgi:N-acetylneuraminate lyase
LQAGADGGIGTTYNFMLRLYRGIYDSFVAGDLESAYAYQQQACRVISALEGEPIIPAAKLLLEEMGYRVGNATFPMKRYSQTEKDALTERIKAAGLRF